MDEELKLISNQRTKDQDYLSRELENYDNLVLRNQETAATDLGAFSQISTTTLHKRKNLDREYEVSNRHKPITK